MKAELRLSPDDRIGAVDPRIYGSFVEHMGRCVYHGLYEPSHPTADADGFRRDVIALVRALQIPIIRYPGGNFVSGYRWEDGVGPRDARPAALDPAWHSVEPNRIGTDEFHRWAKQVGAEVMMAVNLGTRGPAEAAALLEYCNFPKGTKYADLRVKNGREEPYDDRVWCLGNEMDGLWQIGHRTMDDYAQTARKTASLMKMMDPSLELVACGSSSFHMDTFGRWEARVLEEAYDFVDYLSLHQYLNNDGADSRAYLGSPVEMDRFINAVAAVCDHVQSVKHSSRRIHLSFDEWNVWTQRNKSDNDEGWWTVGPRREEYLYSLEDALVFGSQLMSLVRHCDRVKMACQAQLINVAGMIMTQNDGPAWAQTIYYPFLYTSRYGRGTALRGRLTCETYRAERIGDVPYVDSVAVLGEAGDTVTVFAVNRAPEPAELAVTLNGFGQASVLEHVVLEHPDKDAINTAENPQNVRPHADGRTAVVAGNVARSVLPPLSWNMVRLQTGEKR